MPTRTKNRSKSRKPVRRKNKAAIVEIHPAYQEEPAAPIAFDTLRREITKAVTVRALQLVNATMQHIEDGNFQAMKYLFEAVGLLPIKMEDAQPARNELGKKLSDFLEESLRSQDVDPAADSPVPSLAVK